MDTDKLMEECARNMEYYAKFEQLLLTINDRRQKRGQEAWAIDLKVTKEGCLFNLYNGTVPLWNTSLDYNDLHNILTGALFVEEAHV